MKLIFNFTLLLIFVLQFNLNAQNSDTQNSDTQNSDFTFTNLSEALKLPDKVYRLDLSNQSLIKFPDSIFKFKNLRYLSLKNDHFKEIPKEISKLKKLIILDLSGNDFKLLPDAFKELKDLQEVYLNQNSNLDLDKDFKILGKLPKLRILHLEADKLGILPKSINKLISLEKLYLNENDFKQFPVYLSKNKKLVYIDMKNNPLEWKGERPFGITINF